MAQDGALGTRPRAVPRFPGDARDDMLDASNGRSMRVLVAIPCFNEGVTIGSVVLKARQHADEVVVVDDGSTDDTAEVAELAGAKVLRHARNLGKGMAVRTAWLYAREASPAAFVLMDGDHQHHPEDIPRLAERVLANETDLVIGVRWGKTSGMPMYRRVGKRVLDYATAAGVKNGKLTDSQSGYRVFSTAALFSIEPTENGLSIESQMLIDAQDRHFRIDEVNVDFDYDVDGSTTSPGRHGTSVLGQIVSMVSERRPLFFFGLAGTALLVVGAALAFYTAAVYYSSPARIFAIGYAFLFLLFTTVGVLTLFIGIVLNSIKRMLEDGHRHSR